MRGIIHLLRVHQWVKNILLFAPLIFALQFSLSNFLILLYGFLAFSFLASAVYIVNDIYDQAADALHPTKRLRPIASGEVTERRGWYSAGILAACALSFAFILSREFFVIMGFYGAINIAYTLVLKKIVFIDVMVIGLGFVLRILAGSVLIQVPTSHWIILCTFFGALFLGFIKRKFELHTFQDNPEHHRHVLKYYSSRILERALNITGAITIMSYALYTIDPATIARYGTDQLFYTVLFVVFGIFYFLSLADDTSFLGDPVKIFLVDKKILATCVLWLVTFIFIVA